MSITLSPELQSLLDNRLRYLPPAVGEAIRSIEWPEKIITIGRKFGMHVDELEDFQAVVLKSMIGLIAPADFERELVTALALSPANTEKVINEINVQIFEPIHDYVVHGAPAADPMGQAGIHIETPDETPHTPASLSAMQGAATPVASIEFGATIPAVQPEETSDTEPEVDIEEYFK